MQQVVIVQGSAPSLKSAVPVQDHQIRVTWADDQTHILDIQPLLLSHPLFAKVRQDKSCFDTMKVSDDGSRLVWSDGCSLSARAIAKLPVSGMDASEFRNIQADLHLTSEALGSILGLSRRAVTNYRGGDPIPKAIALALKYVHEKWQT